MTSFVDMLEAHRKPELAHEDPVREQERQRQLSLMRHAIGRRIVDVARIPDPHGDDIFLWILAARAQPAEGERVIAIVVLVEQRQERFRLIEVTYRTGVCFLDDGTPLAEALLKGDFNF